MSDIDWSKAPELATHCTPKTDNSGMYRNVFWRVVGEAAVEAWPVNDDWVTAEHFTYGPDGCPSFLIDRAIGRPQYHEWTGTGLPPVGTVCEVQASHINDGYWTEIEILAHAKHDEDDALLVCQLENGSRADMDGVIYAPERFRPIRTQAQIEAEEREKALSHFAYVLYRDVGMDRRDAELLWNKGYRKQEPKQ